MNLISEILDYFIPQEQIQSKNRTYFLWRRGDDSVEVWIPGVKIGKVGKRETRAWIISSFTYKYKTSQNRGVETRFTRSDLYTKETLKTRLNEINRPH